MTWDDEKTDNDGANSLGKLTADEYNAMVVDQKNRISKDFLDAKGDIIVRDGSGISKLVAGTDGYVLTADSAEDKGVKWEAPAGLPPGVLLPYGGSSAPTGFLICDGSAVSRSTYSALFAVISTSYGIGDGSTTFNLPDMQGNVAVGIGGSGVTSIGDTGGEQTHTLILSEIPAHNHTVPGRYSGPADGNYSAATNSSGATRDQTTNSKGSDGAHNNMQPYVGVNYIIKT